MDSISEALDELWKEFRVLGVSQEILNCETDEELIVYAINFLRSNLTDIIRDLEE